MADVSSGWTSSTVVPLYMRNLPATATQSGGGTPSGGVNLNVNVAPGRVSSYKYASNANTPTSAANPLEVGPGSAKPQLEPLKVYGLEDFKTAPGANLNDPSLGSISYLSRAQALPTEVPISTSVFQNPNVPSFLQGQIQQLNSENLMARQAREDLIDRLFIAASEGDYNAWEALRTVGIAPGASAAFGTAIKPPEVAKAEASKLQSEASLNKERQYQARALDRQKNELESKLLKLQALPVSSGIIGSGAQSDPWGRKKLQQEILDLRIQQLKGGGGATQVASSALRGGNTVNMTNAWVGGSAFPALPTY